MYKLGNYDSSLFNYLAPVTVKSHTITRPHAVLTRPHALLLYGVVVIGVQ